MLTACSCPCHDDSVYQADGQAHCADCCEGARWVKLLALADALATAVERDWFGESFEEMPRPPYACQLCWETDYTADGIVHAKDCAVSAARAYRAARGEER